MVKKNIKRKIYKMKNERLLNRENEHREKGSVSIHSLQNHVETEREHNVNAQICNFLNFSISKLPSSERPC